MKWKDYSRCRVAKQMLGVDKYFIYIYLCIFIYTHNIYLLLLLHGEEPSDHLFPVVSFSWYLFQSQRHCKCLHAVYIIEHCVWNCLSIERILECFSMTDWSLQFQVTSLKPVLSDICRPNVTRVHIPNRFDHRPSRYMLAGDSVFL